MSKIPKQALNKGKQIAVYEIKETLGSSLSEITYRAWNEHLNTTVILKEFFPSDYVVRDEENESVRENSKKDMAVFKFGLNNFIQQNEKMLGIQHSGVQNAHNVLKFNHTAYLAVEDEQGTLLSEQLEKSKSFTEEELHILLTSLLNALENIHEAGVVHGDIYPDNILIRKNGEPVLMNIAAARQDFAKHVKMLPFELHQGYAAPEQYEKDSHVGTSVDLYGLGATLYRCVTKTDPVAAKQRMSDLSENKPDPLKIILDQKESGFSEEFLKTIDWMLHPDVKDRPQSVSEVLTELNKDNNLKAVDTDGSVKSEKQDGNHMDSESKESYIVWLGLFVGMISFVAVGLGLIWYLQKDEINWDANFPDQEKQISEVSVAQKSGAGNSNEAPEIQSSIQPKQEKQVLIKASDEVSVKLAEKMPVKKVPVKSTEKEEVSIRESGSGNSSKTPAIQSVIEPKQEKQTLSKLPEEESVKLAEKTPIKEVPVKSTEQKEVASKAEDITDKSSSSEKQVKTDLSSQDISPSEENPVVQVELEKKSEPIVEKKFLSKEDLIKQYMAKAKKKFAALNLTTPSEDNAHHYYKAVLKIDPNHKGAAKGLRGIVDRYILFVDTAIEKDQVDLAEVYLNRAKSVLPNSPYIKEKNDEIAELKQFSRVVDEYEKSDF